MGKQGDEPVPAARKLSCGRCEQRTGGYLEDCPVHGTNRPGQGRVSCRRCDGGVCSEHQPSETLDIRDGMDDEPTPFAKALEGLRVYRACREDWEGLAKDFPKLHLKLTRLLSAPPPEATPPPALTGDFAQALEELRKTVDRHWLRDGTRTSEQTEALVYAARRLLITPPPEDKTGEVEMLRKCVKLEELSGRTKTLKLQEFEAEVDRARRRSESGHKVCFGYEQRIRELEAEAEKLESRPAMTENNEQALRVLTDWLMNDKGAADLIESLGFWGGLNGERNPPPKRTLADVDDELGAWTKQPLDGLQPLFDERRRLLDEEGES